MVGSRINSTVGDGVGRSSAQRQRTSPSGARVAPTSQRRAPGLAQGAALGAAAAALRRCGFFARYMPLVPCPDRYFCCAAGQPHCMGSQRNGLWAHGRSDYCYKPLVTSEGQASFMPRASLLPSVIHRRLCPPAGSEDCRPRSWSAWCSRRRTSRRRRRAARGARGAPRPRPSAPRRPRSSPRCWRRPRRCTSSR